MPFASSSAYPEIVWRGVFSSCDTFAVNSRLICSAFSFSVMSKMRRAMPATFFSVTTGLALNLKSLPPTETVISAFSPVRACLSISCISADPLTERISFPRHASDVPRMSDAVRFTLRISPCSFRTTRPSLIFAVAASNSSLFRSSSFA